MHKHTLLAAGLVALLSGGCAAAPAKPAAGDPLERINRSTYAFNDAVDRAVLKPVARGYQYFVPQPLRIGLGNVVSNLGLPLVFVNDLLQLKPRAAGQDLGRLLINSTFGLGGLLDPAGDVGLTRNDEDFGQTLGYWGVPSGPYLVLPLLGPSTLRDAPALGAEAVADARNQIDNQRLANSLTALTVIDRRAGLLSTEQLLAEAFDHYAFVRNAWLQRRQYLVTDGATPEEEPLEDPLEDPAAATGSEPGAGDAPAAEVAPPP